MLLAGRQDIRPVKTEQWGAGVVICLERCADLHMAQRIPLSLTVSCFRKIQIGLPFWYQLTWVGPEKGPLNGCVCVQFYLRHGSVRPHQSVPANVISIGSAVFGGCCTSALFLICSANAIVNS